MCSGEHSYLICVLDDGHVYTLRDLIASTRRPRCVAHVDGLQIILI